MPSYVGALALVVAFVVAAQSQRGRKATAWPVHGSRRIVFFFLLFISFVSLGFFSLCMSLYVFLTFSRTSSKVNLATRYAELGEEAACFLVFG